MPWALVDDTHGRYFANNKTYFDDAKEERSKKRLPYLGLFALPVDLNTSKVSKPKVVEFLFCEPKYTKFSIIVAIHFITQISKNYVTEFLMVYIH